jgi:putative aldouronate transport system substrate-binding protein
MKSKLKKILCTVLGFLVTVSMAACATATSASTTTAAPQASGTPEATSTPEVKQEDPLGKYDPPIAVDVVRIVDETVKFEPGNPARDSLEKNVWATVYQEKLGITQNYLWTTDASQYDNKWNVSIASGDIPDAAWVDATTYAMLIKGGLVEDMTDIYAKYASDNYKNCQVLDNGIAMKATTHEGKLMGLPFNGQMFEATSMMFIRKDWLDKVSLPVPKTTDELINTIKAFVAAKLGGDQMVGLPMSKQILTGLDDSVGFFNGFGAYYNIWVKQSNGTLSFSNIQPEMRNALLKLQQMYKDGLITQDFAVMDWTKAGEAVSSGKAGVAFGSYPMPIVSLWSNMQNDPKANWQVVPIPTVDGSAPKAQSMMSSVNDFVFVKKGCKYPEAIVKMINLNFELSDLPGYGTENGYEQHKYKFACDLQKPLSLLTMHNKISAAIQNGGDTTGMTPAELTNYNQVQDGLKNKTNAFWMVLGPEPNSTFTIIRQSYESKFYVVNAYQGLPTDTMLEKGSSLNADLEAVMFKVIMGDDISTFDKAVSDWKAMGGDAITKEVNDWYAVNK